MDKPGSFPLLKLPLWIAKCLMISSIAFTGVVFAGAPSLHATGSITGPAAVEMAVKIANE